MGSSDVVTYVPEATGLAFMKCPDTIRGIMGAVGSGKSSVCVMTLLGYAINQAANPNGVRRTKWLIIRATYSELDQTTIKTFQQWVPDNVCSINRDYPRIGKAKFRLADGTTVDSEFIFMALDGQDSIEKVKSLDITGGWINEASEIERAIFEAAYSRKSRYPLKTWPNGYKERPTWAGFLLDTNPPQRTHWYAVMAESEETKGSFFRQPPAVMFDHELNDWVVNPNAENLSNLADDYYKDQLKLLKATNNISFIRVMLQGEYGHMQRGVPVFAQYFSDIRHVDSGMRPPRIDRPIIVGVDWGLNFACVFTQMDAMGNIYIYDEIVKADASLEEVIPSLIKPLISKKYRGFNIMFIGDPAGRGRSSNDKRTPFIIMNDAGLVCKPGPTNNFVVRRDSVIYFLNRVNGMKMSIAVQKLIESIGAGYIMDSGGESAEKNEHSHIADALQYACTFHKLGLAKQSRRTGTKEHVKRRRVV